jgi:hypothetical protein
MYMLECVALRNLEIASFGIEIESAVCAEVEVSTSPTILVELDVPCTPHIQVVQEFFIREYTLERHPIRLTYHN